VARNPFAFHSQDDDADDEDDAPAAAPEPRKSSNEDVDINIELADNTNTPVFGPDGTTRIELDTGDVIIDLDPQGDPEDTDFDDNLADTLGDSILNKIAADLVEGIEADNESRSTWMQIREKGLDLLAFKVDSNGTRATPDATGAMEGISTVRHPLLQEAVLRFQANAYAELCPAAGPAKVVNYGDETAMEDGLADALEKDMNYYLTNIAREYYPETNYMLFDVGFGGIGIKKVYFDPLDERPVSRRVEPQHFIVSNAATDLSSAGRVTQLITMRRSVMRKMQLAGVYRDISLGEPEPDPNGVDRKQAQIQGYQTDNQRPEDQDYTLYECYCELDIPGNEHKRDGEVTGLPLPYKVTIEKDSKRILEIRRNWDEDEAEEDDAYRAKLPFVVFRYVNAMGFYGIGLLHILGNTVTAATMAWRLMLDAYMYANFPGFIYLQGANRQTTNEFRVPPGGGVPMRSDAQDIRQAIMPLPYKSPDAAMNAFIDNIISTGQRVGGTADTPVGEGTAQAPVGTTLALIDQATKIESTVHKGLHSSQDEEFRILKELFRADPASLWRTNKRCALKKNVQKTLIALEDCDVVPRADPNVPSRMHRLAKIAAVKQLQMQSPQLYDAQKVDEWALPQLGVDDPESLFAPPPDPNAQPPMDPIQMMKLQNDRQKTALQAQKMIADMQNSGADRKSKENVAVLNLARELAVHPTSQGVVQGSLGSAPLNISSQIAPTAPTGMADGGMVHNIELGNGASNEGGAWSGSSIVPYQDVPFSTAHMFASGGMVPEREFTLGQAQPDTQQKLMHIAAILHAARNEPRFNPHMNGYDVGVV
jgi:hypothetical protein